MCLPVRVCVAGACAPWPCVVVVGGGAAGHRAPVVVGTENGSKQRDAACGGTGLGLHRPRATELTGPSHLKREKEREIVVLMVVFSVCSVQIDKA